MIRFAIGACALTLLAACQPELTPVEPAPAAAVRVAEASRVEILDPERAAAVIPDGAVVEQLTDAVFTWSEGPVWVSEADGGGYLLFTDVPGNAIHRWSAADGLSTFLQPAGLQGEDTDGIFREPGANGLIMDGPGHVLMGDHGNRALARLDLATKEKTLIATAYDGKRFSSPNDLVMASDGTVYFTDPPYGLKDGDASPAKEMAFNGVYRLPADRSAPVDLIDASLTRPNGVILSPTDGTLYVAVSDPEAAVIYAYNTTSPDIAGSRRVFADLTSEVGPANPGLPDGMAMDTDGRLYATGPGGVRVFDPDGTLIALIRTGTAAANCTFGDDGSSLYITSGPFLARVRLNVTGLGF